MSICKVFITCVVPSFRTSSYFYKYVITVFPLFTARALINFLGGSVKEGLLLKLFSETLQIVKGTRLIPLMLRLLFKKIYI